MVARMRIVNFIIKPTDVNTIWPRATKFGTVKRVGCFYEVDEGLFRQDHARHLSKGSGTSAPQIFGISYIRPSHGMTQQPNFARWLIKLVWQEHFYRVDHSPDLAKNCDTNADAWSVCGTSNLVYTGLGSHVILDEPRLTFDYNLCTFIVKDIHKATTSRRCYAGCLYAHLSSV